MITFILNPVAGGGYAKQMMPQLETILKQRGIPYHVLETKGPEDAGRLAREAAATDTDAVISVGGDGTTYEVATGLMGSGKPLGIIPLGTGNDFIKTLGYPADPKAALEFILTHAPRPIDIGSINERWFLNVCGAGFDVTVLEQSERYRKKMRGLLPYMLGLLRAIFITRPIRLSIETDGKLQEKDVLICSVANGRFIGGGIPICPAAQPDDGMLDVVVVSSVPRWRIPFYLPRLMKGDILRFGITEHILCRKVVLRGKGISVQIDGEIRKMDEAVLNIHPSLLQLYW